MNNLSNFDLSLQSKSASATLFFRQNLYFSLQFKIICPPPRNQTNITGLSPLLLRNPHFSQILDFDQLIRVSSMPRSFTQIETASMPLPLLGLAYDQILDPVDWKDLRHHS